MHFLKIPAGIFRISAGIAASIFLSVPGSFARGEQQSGPPPVIHYQLTVDSADLSGYTVEINLRHAPEHFQLAMATHPEYDDRFWRFVKDFQVTVPAGKGSYSRKDSAVWDLSIPGDEAVIRYRIQIPATTRYAHRPFLSPDGGLVGDLHSFMYLVGQIHIPSPVTFRLPEGWQIATGLERTAGNNKFIASSAATLMDCPALIGRLREWRFTVQGIPYTVAYLPVAGRLAFDTALLVASIQKIVKQAVDLFGSTPYKAYTFLLEDGVYGALEHSNSVTIGAPASLLADHMPDIYGEVAHEFFHSWNLVNIRPAEYTELNNGPQEQSAGLWFSEGMSMFYTDLLLRRAGLPTEDSTRKAHLEGIITRYFSDTGNTVIPPGKVSLASNAPPGMLGDYSASTHLQGELLGALLDLLIRDATDDRHSFDDVMRLMYRRFGGRKGFYARDLEQAVKDVCGDRGVDAFFQEYIYEGHTPDFDPWLRLIGLRLQLSWQPARDDKGWPAADNRVYVWKPAGDTAYRLIMTNPGSCWVKAGLHTGDRIDAIGEQPVKDRENFYNVLKALRPGDTVTIETSSPEGVKKVAVILTGYQKPVVHLINTDEPLPRVQKRREEWEKGRLLPTRSPPTSP